MMSSTQLFESTRQLAEWSERLRERSGCLQRRSPNRSASAKARVLLRQIEQRMQLIVGRALLRPQPDNAISKCLRLHAAEKFASGNDASFRAPSISPSVSLQHQGHNPPRARQD